MTVSGKASGLFLTCCLIHLPIDHCHRKPELLQKLIEEFHVMLRSNKPCAADMLKREDRLLRLAHGT